MLFAIILLAVWAAIIWLCVAKAEQKGRSRVGWGIGGFLFGILALLLIFLMPSRGGSR